jgi:hypothetical protein
LEKRTQFWIQNSLYQWVAARKANFAPAEIVIRDFKDPRASLLTDSAQPFELCMGNVKWGV